MQRGDAAAPMQREGTDAAGIGRDTGMGHTGPVTNPAVPALPPVPRPRSGTDAPSVILPAVLAGILLVSAIVNAAFGLRFPENAPVEIIWCFGITVTLGLAAIALAVRFIVVVRRPRTIAEPRRRPGGLALAAVILSGVAFLGWFAIGGLQFILRLAEGGQDLRYYEDVSGAFFFGLPWMTGLVLGVIGYRSGRGVPNTVCSIVAVILPLLILIPTLFSSIVYGSGLSD